ncbi:tRNA dimethylallyltransferase 1 [Parapedobacter defluvii]|uniref:tRNA dimethylallyltransferase n=1 Tax=Parapedobacter defluvii TaxID=2045106 RepID=A0ABQ1MQH9_9SPHI|nr:tRNA (adenosine(37)-N6)-dimethylallyltransferase MiaA [Parapedobacter defluvii]GGC44943.1 tRNA dimethylallyltransferase 1 [Parapedobacter defluvii]
MEHAAAKTLVCVVGPTAIGKTAVAIQLAQHLQTVILSADSRQFYREMNIGTAKPTPEELAAVPHYFVNSHRLTDLYSAGDFERDALQLLKELFARHDVVLLVGGSGLFVDAVCRGLDDLPQPLPGVRDQLNRLYADKGLPYLQQRLKEVDPLYYQEVDIYNPQRVIRALEVHESTGQPFSHFRKQQRSNRPFQIHKLGLNTDRQNLYQRINARVDAMMDAGLLEEVASLLPYRNLPPLQTVGYAELFEYLDGNCALEEAVDRIKQNTRRYAKRQLTWFRKDPLTQWFEPTDVAEMKAYITGD